MAIHDWSGSGMTGFQGNMYCLTNANARWLQQNGYLPTNTLFANDNNCPTVATLNSYANANAYATSEYAGLGNDYLCPVGYIQGALSGIYTHNTYGSAGCGTDFNCACTAFSDPPTGLDCYSYQSEGSSPAVGIHLYTTNTGGILSGPFANTVGTSTIDVIKWRGTTKVSLKTDGSGAINSFLTC